MRYVHPSPLLKGVLIADAAASGALALLQIVGNAALAGLTNLPSSLLGATGVFLLGYPSDADSAALLRAMGA